MTFYGGHDGPHAMYLVAGLVFALLVNGIGFWLYRSMRKTKS